MEGAVHAAPSGAEWRQKEIELAAHELLQYFDAKSTLTIQPAPATSAAAERPVSHERDRVTAQRTAADLCTTQPRRAPGRSRQASEVVEPGAQLPFRDAGR